MSLCYRTRRFVTFRHNSVGITGHERLKFANTEAAPTCAPIRNHSMIGRVKQIIATGRDSNAYESVILACENEQSGCPK
jgi:hypothetical protein